MIRRKASRRTSAQYYVSAEEHVDNEVKHERLLTETSRLSSSWASLSVSGNEKTESECSSSSVSANNSPSHRPHSFSGPLVISVTCSGSACSGAHSCCPAQVHGNRGTPTSPTPHVVSSGHASPVASPVSSRVQCYSPSLVSATNSPTTRRPHPGSASPLLISTALCRKRGYLSSMLTGGCSSDDASREASPDPFLPSRGSKSMRQGEGRAYSLSEASQFRWPISGPPIVSNPPSPSCQLFPNPICTANTPGSPSTSSLPSPRLSITSSIATYQTSPSTSSNNLNSSFPQPSNHLAANSPRFEEQTSLSSIAMDDKSVSMLDTSESGLCSPSGARIGSNEVNDP